MYFFEILSQGAIPQKKSCNMILSVVARTGLVVGAKSGKKKDFSFFMDKTFGK